MNERMHTILSVSSSRVVHIHKKKPSQAKPSSSTRPAPIPYNSSFRLAVAVVFFLALSYAATRHVHLFHVNKVTLFYWVSNTTYLYKYIIGYCPVVLLTCGSCCELRSMRDECEEVRAPSSHWLLLRFTVEVRVQTRS